MRLNSKTHSPSAPTVIGFFLLALTACGNFSSNCTAPTSATTSETGFAPVATRSSANPSPTEKSEAAAMSVTVARGGLPAGARIEKVVDANFPTSLAFASDGRVFYTEKNTGNLRVISASGQLLSEPVVHLDTDGTNERGLLGIALDPNFSSNHALWLYHTLPGNPTVDEIVRVTLEGNRATQVESALRSPNPGRASNHNGGVIHFGPDGMLYGVIGEHAMPALAQDTSKIPGKVHRFAPSVPLTSAPGNPFPNSSIFAYGLRNSFGFDFDPLTGKLFVTINGPNCDDYVIIAQPGSNLGWRPNYPCGDANPEFFKPLLPLIRYQKPPALTQLTFYRGNLFPEWKNDIFFCAFNDSTMRHVKLNAARDAFASVETFPMDSVSCLVDVETGIDGALWFTSGRAIYRMMK